MQVFVSELVSWETYTKIVIMIRRYKMCPCICLKYWWHYSWPHAMFQILFGNQALRKTGFTLPFINENYIITIPFAFGYWKTVNLVFAEVLKFWGKNLKSFVINRSKNWSFFFFFFLAAPVAYGSFWVRDWIWATAATYATAEVMLDP